MIKVVGLFQSYKDMPINMVGKGLFLTLDFSRFPQTEFGTFYGNSGVIVKIYLLVSQQSNNFFIELKVVMMFKVVGGVLKCSKILARCFRRLLCLHIRRGWSESITLLLLGIRRMHIHIILTPLINYHYHNHQRINEMDTYRS